MGLTGYISASGFEDPSWMGTADAGRTVVAAMQTRTIDTPPGESMPEMEIWIKKASSYSLPDLAGTWELSALAPYYSMWSEGKMMVGWWGRGTITIDSNGSFLGVINGSDGSTTPMSRALSITSGGVVIDNLDASLKCFADEEKTVMACTGGDLDPLHGPAFSILLRKGPSYSLSDLVGTWQYSELESELWWQRGSLTVNSGGSYSLAPDVLFMDQFFSGILPETSGILEMTPEGYFGIPHSPTRCVLDSGKTVAVCTNYFPEDGGEGTPYSSALAILVKIGI
jgi:hypothetical protein